MKRRTFLKRLGIGTAAVVTIPTILIGKKKKTQLLGEGKGIQISPDGNWEINHNTKTIKYVGEKANYHKPLDLHRQLQEMADDFAFDKNPNVLDITSPNPSIRYTDQHIELLTHRVEDNSLKNLHNGTIKQKALDGQTEYLMSVNLKLR